MGAAPKQQGPGQRSRCKERIQKENDTRGSAASRQQHKASACLSEGATLRRMLLLLLLLCVR